MVQAVPRLSQMSGFKLSDETRTKFVEARVGEGGCLRARLGRPMHKDLVDAAIAHGMGVFFHLHVVAFVEYEAHALSLSPVCNHEGEEVLLGLLCCGGHGGGRCLVKRLTLRPKVFRQSLYRKQPQQMSSNQFQIAKQVVLGGAPVARRNSLGSEAPSEAPTTLTQAVAAAQAAGAATRTMDTTTPLTEQQELQTLRQIIVTWRELEAEVSDLSQQVREKKKRQKALEEMILRIMKKHNIGALDLKGSGGRLLYRRQSTKTGLNPKVLTGLLAAHLKSETAAAEAIKYINEHREAKVRESLLYEKD